jgi:hypothetical protein
MCDTLQLQSSILLGSLSLITNNTLRYACLGLATGISAIYVSYLMRPSMQLRLLEDTIQSTENAIIGAKAHYPRDRNLMEQGVRLLEYANFDHPPLDELNAYHTTESKDPHLRFDAAC